MNPVHPYGDIDLTSYLQTEGRKRAAELALKQGASGAADKVRPVIHGHDHGSNTPVQQDASHNPSPPPQEQQSRPVRQAGSLTEVLQQMGVTGSGRRGTR